MPRDDPDGYARQWSEYRRRRRLAFGLALAMAPVAVLWVLAGDRPALEPLAVAVSFVWLIGAAVSGWRFGRFPCPRCTRPFGMTSGKDWALSLPGDRLRMLLSPRCLHCGLPKWAPRDPDAARST